MNLIPFPQKLERHDGCCDLSMIDCFHFPLAPSRTLVNAVTALADEWYGVICRRPRFAACEKVAFRTVMFRIDPAVSVNTEGYTLVVKADGIELTGSSEAGLFYAVQTLRQLLRTEGASLPCLAIADAPVLGRRGFYHDATRGRVPTLESMKHIADVLAYYKLNELQLYVEHTFAFEGFADMWGGSDPLTAEEILTLDAYCRDRNIELVPSLSTFGHFYMGLRSKRLEHLNELEVSGGDRGFSFVERMMHYTLDAQNPESFEVVRKLLAQFIPLFRSKFFNICCDETFDLGKGRNRKLADELGSSRLYMDFLKKIIGEVNRYGKVAMFWGDIILKDPAMIGELPEGTIALDWNYSSDFNGESTACFAKSGTPFYVCSGTHAWNSLLPDIGSSEKNIVLAGEHAQNYGALGLLNTNWGDCGHANMFGCSLHGLARGAAAGWNNDPAYRAGFDRAFAALEFGLADDAFVKAWRRAAGCRQVDWHAMVLLVDIHFSDTLEERLKDLKVADIRAGLEQVAAARRDMLAAAAAARPRDPLAREQVLVGVEGVELEHKVVLAVLAPEEMPPCAIADELRQYESAFGALWLRDSKASEYYRIRTTMLEVATLLDARGSAGQARPCR